MLSWDASLSSSLMQSFWLSPLLMSTIIQQPTHHELWYFFASQDALWFQIILWEGCSSKTPLTRFSGVIRSSSYIPQNFSRNPLAFFSLPEDHIHPAASWEYSGIFCPSLWRSMIKANQRIVLSSGITENFLVTITWNLYTEITSIWFGSVFPRFFDFFINFLASFLFCFLSWRLDKWEIGWEEEGRCILCVFSPDLVYDPLRFGWFFPCFYSLLYTSFSIWFISSSSDLTYRFLSVHRIIRPPSRQSILCVGSSTIGAAHADSQLTRFLVPE